MSEPSPSLRHRIEAAGLSFLVWAVGRLPYGALRRIANFLGGVVFIFDQRGRTVARANLDAVFGDQFTPERKKEIARASYQTFARTMLELFWSPNLTKELCLQLTRPEGLELDPCHHDSTQAAIYACLHYANFEWLNHTCAIAICTGPVIAQRFKNPLIGPIFNRLRASTGNHVVTQERAMIKMLKHLKSGGKFGILSDLNLDPSESGIIIDTFGGLKVCATQMHSALALRTGAKIVPLESRPQPDGTYRTIFHKPLEYPENANAQQIAQQCWDVLERSIREQPECWLWSYKHWRFKPSDDQSGRYPFYANAAKRFDKLLRQTEKAAAN